MTKDTTEYQLMKLDGVINVNAIQIVLIRKKQKRKRGMKMTQEETIKFLGKHGMDVDNMSFNEVNLIMDIANKVAEETYKECLLTFCEASIQRKSN